MDQGIVRGGAHTEYTRSIWFVWFIWFISFVCFETWPHSFEQSPEVFKWSLCCYLRCQFTRRQHHGIRLIRCLPVQARMGSRSVVPIQVLHNRLPGFSDGVVGM